MALVVLTVVIGGIFLARNYFAKDPAESEISRILAQNKADEVPPSAVDPSLELEINTLIANRKFSEAKAKLEKLKTEPGLTTADKARIYSSLANVCTQLRDTACLQQVAAYQRSVGPLDIFLLLDLAGFEAERGNTQEKTKLYQEVLKEIDGRGGQEYINQLNQSTQRLLDYDEIKAEAGR